LNGDAGHCQLGDVHPRRGGSLFQRAKGGKGAPANIGKKETNLARRFSNVGLGKGGGEKKTALHDAGEGRLKLSAPETRGKGSKPVVINWPGEKKKRRTQ